MKTTIADKAALLAGCLEEINGSLVELTAVFRVKRQVLARGDMAALDELLAREQLVTEALFDAETRREVLVEEIAAGCGVEGMRLVDIAGALGGAHEEALVEAGLRARDTMEMLTREARIVAEICRAAVDHYDKLIRIVTGAGLAPVTYTASGQGAQGAARRNIIDQSI